MKQYAYCNSCKGMRRIFVRMFAYKDVHLEDWSIVYDVQGLHEGEVLCCTCHCGDLRLTGEEELALLEAAFHVE